MGVDPTQHPQAPGVYSGGAPDTRFGGGAPDAPPPADEAPPADTPSQVDAPPADAAAETSEPEVSVVDQASIEAQQAAHDAAAAQVAHVGPIVWGDRGEVVLIAAKLLRNATGADNQVAAGSVQPMWSSELADQCAKFQADHELVVALPGCLDAVTWAALEQAAQASGEEA